MFIYRLALLCIVAFWTTSGSAQLSIQIHEEGYHQVCKIDDFRVPVISSDEYGGYAEAKKDLNGIPYIVYNPLNMFAFPQLFQNFTFFHECAHIKLGHVHNYPGTNPILEQEADCWSIRYMDSFQIYSREELIERLETHFSSRGWLGSNTHKSGDERASYLSSCFDSLTRIN